MPFDSKKMVYIIVAIILLAAFSSYLFYQFRFYVRVPELILEVPAEDMVIGESHIEIKGRIDTGTTLTLNGRPIYIKETGEFQERVNLGQGLNALEFEAQNKAGKITKIVRYILVRDKWQATRDKAFKTMSHVPCFMSLL